MEDTWIVDPPGHRRMELMMSPPDGAEVETAFGKAVVINTATLMDVDEWVCDLCNASCVVADGSGDSWPVAVVGGYALCIPCTYEMEVWPRTICACSACLLRWREWIRAHPGRRAAFIRAATLSTGN